MAALGVLPSTTAVPSGVADHVRTDSGPAPVRRFDHVLRDQTSKGEANPQNGSSRDGDSESTRPSSADNGSAKHPAPGGSGRLPGIQGESDPKAVLGWLQDQGDILVANPSGLPSVSSSQGAQPAAPVSVSTSTRTVRSAIAAVGTMMGFRETAPRPVADETTESSGDDESPDPTLDSLLGGITDGTKAATTAGTALALCQNALPPAESAQGLAGQQAAAISAAMPSAVLGNAGVMPFAASQHSLTSSPVGASSIAVDSTELPVRLGEQIQWLVNSGGSEARLVLHPVELGAINVQVRIEDRGASVWFSAEHPAARAALEAALPQLRERFASEGVVLDRARVTSDGGSASFGDARQQSGTGLSSDPSSDWGPTGPDEEGESGASRLPVPAAIVHLGLLDRYA